MYFFLYLQLSFILQIATVVGEKERLKLSDSLEGSYSRFLWPPRCNSVREILNQSRRIIEITSTYSGNKASAVYYA